MTQETYDSIMYMIHLEGALAGLNLIVAALLCFTAYRQWKLAKLQRENAERLRAAINEEKAL